MSYQALPLFTVVMPCFRAGATIATAIASVLAQTDWRLELIVVDDGCPEGSGDIALAAIGRDPRGRVIRQENAGPAAARNRGAAIGKGALLAFLDADDRWMPGLLAMHRDHFCRRKDLGVSFGRIRFFDSTLTHRGRSSAHVPMLALPEAMAENPCCTTSNLVMRRCVFTALGGFDSELTHAEDQEFVVRVLATTPWRVAGIDAELVHYRMSAQGLSADLVRMEAGWRAMLERARGYTDPVIFRPAERRARALFARYLARRALRTGQPAWRALRHLGTALLIHPACLFGRETRRTLLTLGGAVAALILPGRLMRPLVAR